MRTVSSLKPSSRWMLSSIAVVFCLALALPSAVAQDDPAPVAAASADATVEGLFTDFLHYARLGRFTAADAFAKAMLEHPDLTAVAVLDAASKERNSRDTLLILIKNSSIGDRAARVLELIEQGERDRSKDTDRILANIRQLGGSPQQEFYAIKHLAESGEYAVPHMIGALLDPQMADLKARIVNALPQIGKSAVNPLVMALKVDNDDVRLHVINAIGEIGYPQAYPYLMNLTLDPDMPDSAKKAAKLAADRIATISGRPMVGETDAMFFKLAEKYYDNDPSVQSDPRIPESNVWYWDADSQALAVTVVPQRLFSPIMAMRCCEEALLLTPDMIESSALWLAANIRREALLGLNIESGDPAEVAEPDPTRPDVFPRALYFTQAAGPRYAHLVLERAVKDREAPVALGAIEALRITAGEASLIGSEDYKQPLVEALQFPDLLVRIRAALALGAALPKSQFADSQLVMPVLANALAQTGSRQVLVVDPDEASLNRVVGELRDAGSEVIGETSFFAGLNRARGEFQALRAIFVSTDIESPDLTTAVGELRGEFIYSKTPIIFLVKQGQTLMAEELKAMDKYTDAVDAFADGASFVERWDEINARTAQADLDQDLALSIALQAAETLRMLAVDGRTVLPFEEADKALIKVLGSPAEELQIKSASVLALASNPAAQRAIAFLALESGNSVTVRVAAFNSLAESAKNNGNLLEDRMIADLVNVARDDDDLVIRTAASQALGAINLETSKASEIIRKYYGG